MRGERGVTAPEALIILAIVAVVGVLAATGSFGALPSLGSSPSAKDEATDVAEREIERLRSLGWSRLLMTAAPAASTNADSPLSKLGSETPRTYTAPGAEAEPLALADVPTADPDFVNTIPGEWEGSEAWGKVHRFITWTGDGGKRLVVAVTVDSPGGPTSPIYSTAIVGDPAGGQGSRDAARAQEEAGAQVPDAGQLTTLHAYDTPASHRERQAQDGDHALHDTTAVPDLMGADAAPSGPDAPLVNYSTDLGGGVAGGRVLKRAQSGCDGRGKEEIQVWATAPYEAPITLTGNGSASLWTQSAEGSSGAGELCLTVLDLELDSSGRIIGRPEVIGSTAQGLESWPSEPKVWPMEFRFFSGNSRYELEAGHSLGVQLTLQSASESDVAILYDHPSFATLFQFGVASADE